VSAAGLFDAMQGHVGLAVAVVLVLTGLLLVPYLIQEIRKGKRELGPNIPTGTGDALPGKRGNPAPGQPDAQADPYDRRAQR
jgi:hypothetical protein